MSESPPRKSKEPLSRRRRVTGWVCNVLATLIILFGGWMVGREMIGWWGEPAEEANPRQIALDMLGRGEMSDAGVPHSLQTAEMDGSLGRQRFTGDRKAAMAQLRRRCRVIVGRSAPPAAPALASELKMLATLDALSPVEHGPISGEAAIWEIFQLDGPLPMVAATRKTAAESRKKAVLAASDQGGEVAPFDRRVVCWGLALAASEHEWTLFTYHLQEGRLAVAAGSLEVPLPPGAERTLTLRFGEGEGVVGFRQRAPRAEQNSNETPQAWMQFYDRWLVGHGYSPDVAWRNLHGSWHARFEHPEAGRIEIQLARDRDHNIGGTLVLRAAPSGSRE